VVLDPFNGAGTTGLAALKNGRRYIGIELNAEYVKITRERAEKYMPLLISGL
jgi:DNA modification methylase